MKEEKLSLDTIHTKKVDDITAMQIQNHYSADRQAISKRLDPANADKSIKVLERAIKERESLIEFLTRQAEELKELKENFDVLVDKKEEINA